MKASRLLQVLQEELSDEQLGVVLAKGNVVVEACPGSGKTATVAARVAYRLSDWESRSGLAVLSFTNVAQQEIASRLEEKGFLGHLGHPHFLGTLNSFVVQYLFLPFGHLVMSNGLLKYPPRLVMDFNESWVCSKFPLPRELMAYRVVDFHWNRHGSLEWVAPHGYFGPEPSDCSAAIPAKTRMAAAGYATHQDSMYWALQVLKRYPYLAESLARRFSEVIIDEAQDSSEIQLSILGRLFQTGGVNMMFVGDADQGIYDFQRAQPELLKKLAGTKGWRVLPLSSNFRSSQLICDAAFQFSTLKAVATATGRDKDCSWKPILLRYPDRKITWVADEFKKLLARHRVASSEAVIVTRRNSDVKRIAGVQDPVAFPRGVPEVTRKLVKAVSARDQGDWQSAVSGCERFATTLGFPGVDLDWADQIPPGWSTREWKRFCGELTESLPSVSQPLNDWLSAAKAVISSLFQANNFTVSQIGRHFPRLKAQEATIETKRFTALHDAPPDITVKTIHQAKGETHSATMVVASPRSRTGPSEVLKWFDDAEETGLRPEAMRRAYVAMTRPRKLLVVAVPDSAWDEVKDRFIGFEALDQPFAQAAASRRDP